MKRKIALLVVLSGLVAVNLFAQTNAFNSPLMASYDEDREFSKAFEDYLKSLIKNDKFTEIEPRSEYDNETYSALIDSEGETLCQRAKRYLARDGYKSITIWHVWYLYYIDFSDDGTTVYLINSGK